jgi:hypothetical protein
MPGSVHDGYECIDVFSIGSGRMDGWVGTEGDHGGVSAVCNSLSDVGWVLIL